MVGRHKEIEILKKAYTSDKAELAVVLGRRRVGKTYLVRTLFQEKIDFELVGLKDGSKEQQLRNFGYSLKTATKSDVLVTPKDWLDAFYLLTEHLESLGEPNRKKIVFIDELPWIATAKSDFLTGFGYFWNSFASKKNVLVIICGSATAWMINKIINDKGGLHNRMTRRIHLLPFTLTETEAYFKYRNINFDRYQLLLLYMAIGGIPHYLDQVEGGKSAVQNIDNICFHPQGLLRTEFDNLYSSLFANPARYETVIGALSNTWKGLSRMEVLEDSGMKDGGGLSGILQDLEQSGFISTYIPFNKKKKDTLYRLTDYYSLFYLKFIRDNPSNALGMWNALSQTQTFKVWSGYAFENICLQHIDKIKTALGIAGVLTRQSSFLEKGNGEKEGAQIDLLIDRQDNCISLCEVKFYNDAMVLSKTDADVLRRKKGAFQRSTGSKKHIFITLITTYGLTQNVHSIGLVDQVLDMNDLF